MMSGPSDLQGRLRWEAGVEAAVVGREFAADVEAWRGGYRYLFACRGGVRRPPASTAPSTIFSRVGDLEALLRVVGAVGYGAQ